MGVTISKLYSSYKSQWKVFKLFLNFPSIGFHQTGIIEILCVRFATFLLRNFKFTTIALLYRSIS